MEAEPNDLGLKVKVPLPDILTVTPPSTGEVVIRISHDGRLFWHGREVETDTEFRGAMMDLARRLWGQ
jgi:hypothetical protein